MSTVKVATSKLTALANAVRSKSGESEELTLNDIPTIIPSLATPPIPSATWADGTWEEIAQALADHKAGKIDLYTTPGWEIGATRTVPLSAMDATGVSESYIAQDAEIVLTDKNVYDLADGTGKCVFTWDLKNSLVGLINGRTFNGGHMNSANTNSGGWDGSARRTWCNNVFYNALPASFKALVPQVKVKASAGNQSSVITTSSDYCFLRAEIEVFGALFYSAAGEGSQIEYYRSSANRIKKAGVSGSANWWWERSPDTRNAYFFARVLENGSANSDRADSGYGIAPCGCI